MKLYSIYDKKSSRYDMPFPSENHETAIRTLKASLGRGMALLESFPGDYSLVYIGEYDNDTGTLTNVDNFVLAEVTELVQSSRQAIKADERK